MALNSQQDKFLEETSATFTATLLSDKTDPLSTISAVNLVSLTMTLYDKCSGTIINTRENQDILNTNDVTVDANGLLTWNIQPEDTIIVGENVLDGEYEEHIALITWVWSDGTGREEISMKVEQLDKVG